MPALRPWILYTAVMSYMLLGEDSFISLRSGETRITKRPVHIVGYGRPNHTTELEIEILANAKPRLWRQVPHRYLRNEDAINGERYPLCGRREVASGHLPYHEHETLSQARQSHQSRVAKSCSRLEQNLCRAYKSDSAKQLSYSRRLSAIDLGVLAQMHIEDQVLC